MIYNIVHSDDAKNDLAELADVITYKFKAAAYIVSICTRIT